MHRSRPALIRTIGSQWGAVLYGGAVMFFLMAFLARKLGPSSLAIFLYIQAIGAIFAIFQDGGFQALIFREKVAPSEQTAVNTDVLVAGYFSYVALATLLGAAGVLLAPTAFKTGFILAFIYYALRCVTNIISALLKGQGAFTREALWRFQIFTFLAVPVLILVCLTPPTPEKVFLAFSAGMLLLLATKNGREFISRPKLTFLPWRVWKTCISFVVIGGASMIYFKSGVIMLKHLQPDLALVGQYGAAFQLLEGVVVLASPVVQLLFRYMRLSWLDRKTFSERFRKSMTGVIAVALVITAAGILFAPGIIVLIFGKAYRPAADILPVLLPALLFMLPNFILTQGLIALNGERYYAVSAVLCACFNVGLNYFLIPRYLAAGAAVSTVATEFLLTLLAAGWFIRWHRAGAAAQNFSGEDKKP